MRNVGTIISRPTIATWIVAGALLVGVCGSVAAEDATLAQQPQLQVQGIDIAASTALIAIGTKISIGESTRLAMPTNEIGPGLATGETGPMGLGALVGAGVAAVYALRERFKSR